MDAVAAVAAHNLHTEQDSMAVGYPQQAAAQRETPSRLAQNQEENEADRESRVRVLVVEDDDVIRQLVSATLEEEGYEVLQAPHGEVALELVEQAPPDVVLLDMRMPVMDGWEFARRYRQHAQPRGHVVVMTAAVDALERAGQIDVDTVLPKPFDLNDLLSCVERYTRPGRAATQWM